VCRSKARSGDLAWRSAASPESVVARWRLERSARPKDTRWDRHLSVAPDGEGLIGHAGAVLLRKLARQYGLTTVPAPGWAAGTVTSDRPQDGRPAGRKP
jgi:hypothetical protein